MSVKMLRWPGPSVFDFQAFDTACGWAEKNLSRYKPRIRGSYMVLTMEGGEELLVTPGKIIVSDDETIFVTTDAEILNLFLATKDFVEADQ